MRPWAQMATARKLGALPPLLLFSPERSCRAAFSSFCFRRRGNLIAEAGHARCLASTTLSRTTRRLVARQAESGQLTRRDGNCLDWNRGFCSAARGEPLLALHVGKASPVRQRVPSRGLLAKTAAILVSYTVRADFAPELEKDAPMIRLSPWLWIRPREALSMARLGRERS